MKPTDLPVNVVYVGREILGELSLAESREYLATNGIGGYVSMTLANSLTRSYHGLLIAALRPPLDRTLLLSKLNETVIYQSNVYHLGTDRRRERSVKRQAIVRRLAPTSPSLSSCTSTSSSSSTTFVGSTLPSHASAHLLNKTPPHLLHLPVAPTEGPTQPPSQSAPADDVTGFVYPIWRPLPSSSPAPSLPVPPLSPGEVISPYGFELLQSFHLEGTVPTFVYSFGDAVLEKRVWMKHGCNTVYVTYYLRRAMHAVQLRLKALVNHRNHHRRTNASRPHFDYSANVGADGASVSVLFTTPTHPNYTNLCMRVSRGRAALTNEWVSGFVLAEERARGLPDIDDNLHVATFLADLPPGGRLTFMATAEPDGDSMSMDGDAELDLQHAYEKSLLQKFDRAREDDFQRSVHASRNTHDHGKSNDSNSTEPKSSSIHNNLNSRTISTINSLSPASITPEDLSPKRRRRVIEPFIKQLVLAADQFIISRAGGRSIVAGFHWFADWARDTMISLPGLTIATGRYDVAKSILQTFSKFVSKGMLPNRFPDDGSEPTESEYDNADGTLWYFEAIRAYFSATSDVELLLELYPVLQNIISQHCKGTRFGIEQDTDGLLKAGADGYALTWMDAKTDVVYTPRRGKAVEIAALWYNALNCMAFFAEVLEHDDESDRYTDMADETQRSFQQKFWNEDAGYCFDVVEVNGNVDEHDLTLRPNQLIAASLNWSPLTQEQRLRIVDACAQSLLVSHAVRTLPPYEKKYRGIYLGDIFSRDMSYHQGVAWTWLLGPFVIAHLRVHGNKAKSREFLKPILMSHLNDAGVGQVSELFDGSAPNRARGCIAQAWSVAELLRAWLATDPSPDS